MNLYQFVLLTSFGLIEVYMQLRYAWAGYPKTRRWKMILFSSSFSIGVGISVLLGLEYPQLGLGRLLIVILTTGLVCGFVFTFLFPEQMQVLYPNRNQSDDLGQK